MNATEAMDAADAAAAKDREVMRFQDDVRIVPQTGGGYVVNVHGPRQDNGTRYTSTEYAFTTIGEVVRFIEQGYTR